jgi:hypothetical protein
MIVLSGEVRRAFMQAGVRFQRIEQLIRAAVYISAFMRTDVMHRHTEFDIGRQCDRFIRAYVFAIIVGFEAVHLDLLGPVESKGL